MKMPPPPPKFSLTNLVEKPDVNTTFLLGSVGKISGRKREMDVKHRPRADSLEILRSSRDTDWYLKKAHSDPISFSPEVNVEKAEKSQEEPVVHQRRRSASCSVPSSSSPSTTGATFDPILEEPVGNELQRILEGDS